MKIEKFKNRILQLRVTIKEIEKINIIKRLETEKNNKKQNLGKME